jgi:transposase
MTRPIGTAAELERQRRRAVELLQQGESPSTLARILGVHETSVYRWRRLAEHGSGLQAKPHPGPKPRLSTEQWAQVEQLLLLGAKHHGWHNDLWTAARAAALIERHFGVRYHPEHVRAVLKGRFRWTCQRPQLRKADRDEDAIKAWIQEKFPLIMEQTTARAAYTVFVDEAGFMLEPILRRTYAPRGKTPVQRLSDPHGRISVIGATAISPRRDSLSFMYDLLADNANYRGEAIAAFMRVVQSRLAGPMTVIWDQIPIHCCEPINDFTAAFPDVVLEPFPPYAPELNPTDRVWGYVKYHRLPNFTPPDLGALRSSVVRELERVSGRSDLLRAFVRATKLPLSL